MIQLQAGAEVGRGHWIGRIVHVVSGQSSHFGTLPQLVAFIERHLAGGDGEAPPPSVNEP